MSHDHKTLLQPVRANNFAHWLSNDDISAVLSLRYDIQEFRVIGDEQLLLAIVEIFQANVEPHLLSIVINKGGVHWTCLGLERCGGRFFAYHQDSQAKHLSQKWTRLLGVKRFTVFDAGKEQQPSEEQDNCGIWVLLNISSILAMLQKRGPENRMTIASWEKRARMELQKALRTCKIKGSGIIIGENEVDPHKRRACRARIEIAFNSCHEGGPQVTIGLYAARGGRFTEAAQIRLRVDIYKNEYKEFYTNLKVLTKQYLADNQQFVQEVMFYKAIHGSKGEVEYGFKKLRGLLIKKPKSIVSIQIHYGCTIEAPKGSHIVLSYDSVCKVLGKQFVKENNYFLKQAGFFHGCRSPRKYPKVSWRYAKIAYTGNIKADEVKYGTEYRVHEFMRRVAAMHKTKLMNKMHPRLLDVNPQKYFRESKEHVDKITFAEVISSLHNSSQVLKILYSIFLNNELSIDPFVREHVFYWPLYLENFAFDAT
ncbi:hypothetical protein TKK_0011155 [Trichogramma kaykai]